MAHIVTLNLLIDSASEDDAIKAALAAISTQAAIIDSSLEDVKKTPHELEDSITNEAYRQGDAFASWVIYSRSEAEFHGDNAGFWSNTYGWTILDLATRYSPAPLMTMPGSRQDDATLILDSQARGQL